VPLLLVVAGVLVWWRGPDWAAVGDAFAAVRWEWVVAAVLLNLLSIVTRSLAWDTTIHQSLPPPYPRWRLVFSAFCVGLFANAVLPARAGELARVAVLRRRLPARRGTTAALIGSVFAHRMFDLFPTVTLVIWVLIAAQLPPWTHTVIAAVVGIGVILFLVAWLAARRGDREAVEGMGRLRHLLARMREGLAIMRSPAAAAKATLFQFGGWLCQLLAVWSAMRGFNIHLPLSAAGLVLVIMNIVTIFPFWPGNIGLVQVAIARALNPYGVAYTHGIAFGLGLQAIEASVGIGVGLVFLAREGLSYAMLKQFAPAIDAAAAPAEEERERPRAGVPG
jgi:uncharacterized protein (TIRG00374 family)